MAEYTAPIALAGPAGVVSRTEGHRHVLVGPIANHTLFRTGLRHMLEEQGSAVVEARNGEIAVETAANVVPDVVLIDLHMPGMSGVEATRSITAAEPSARIVMLTVSADEQDVLDAVLAGACGYLLKDAPVEDVVRPPSTPSGAGRPDRARAAGAPARRPGGGR